MTYEIKGENLVNVTNKLRDLYKDQTPDSLCVNSEALWFGDAGKAILLSISVRDKFQDTIVRSFITVEEAEMVFQSLGNAIVAARTGPQTLPVLEASPTEKPKRKPAAPRKKFLPNGRVDSSASAGRKKSAATKKR